MPSGSINSVYSDDSEEGYGGPISERRRNTGLFAPARFYLEERRNSEALESDEDDMMMTSEAEDDKHYESEDEDEKYDGVPKDGTIEALLHAIGAVISRKRRLRLFESFFFSAPDFGDPSCEQMTSKIADFVEDSKQLDVLEMWLLKYRAVDKLRFYDPSVTARVREVIDDFLTVREDEGTLKVANSKVVSSALPREFAAAKALKDTLDHGDEEAEEQDDVGDDDDVGSVVRVEPRHSPRRARADDDSSSSSSSSATSGDSSDGDGSPWRTIHRLVRRLNRSELDMANLFPQSATMTNEWEHDFEEERGKRGLGVRRRYSESDVALSVVTHARMSHPSHDSSSAVGGLDMEDEEPRLRRAQSLPYLLLWSEAPTRTRREFSTSSVGSFSFRSFSQLTLSPRHQNKVKDMEDEEHCVSEMLAFVVAPPLAVMVPSGSMSQASTGTTTTTAASTTGSPPPVTAGTFATGKTDSLFQRRTLSIDAGSPQILHAVSSGSGLESWPTEVVSFDGTFDILGGPISPVSDHSRRRLDDPAHKGGTERKLRRESSASHHHYKQPSTSSLHTLLSQGGPRRTAISSSFSSFVEADSLMLPDRSLRGDIKRYDPRLVAEQLLITMCRSGYFQITPQALRTVEARKRDEAVQRMVRFFEVLSYWPVTEILTDSKRTASDRIDDFGWFVSLAKSSRELGNYHAVFAIVGGLQSPLLVWVTEIAHRKHKRQFNVLKRLVKTDNNYRVYHADLSKRSAKLPCIPYLGLLNRNMLTLQCDTPVYTDSEKRRINFTRCIRTRSAVVKYLKWQTPVSHSLPSNGVLIDPCIRKALAESMSRSVLDYRELSTMSSVAKSGFVKSLRQRAFHRARIFGHQIVGEERG